MENFSYAILMEYFSGYIAYRPGLEKYFSKITTPILASQLEPFLRQNPKITKSKE